ncbi:MAG: alpha/beta hydrolase [Hyphomonadaceae bacterium]|nr:alpha/beta hydrolase [Hyphomonadaceae bacterium]
MSRRTLIVGAAATGLSACTPSLGAFNRFAPHDEGAVLAAEDIAFGAGPRQKLDVYAPAGGVQRAPVLVFFYGGSWRSGAKKDYGFLGDAFASRGFVTVVPDYRIAPDVFPSFLEDGAAAVAWVQSEIASFGGDPDRIVLAGHSAGGYIAVMLALDGAYLSVAGADIGKIRGVAGLAGPYDFLPFDVDATREAFGSVTDPLTTQPTHFARADAPALWLGWGEKDETVGRRNIDALSAAQRQVGGSVETKLYPNLGHVGILLALSRPFRGRAPVLDDVTAFAERVTA